MTTVSKSTSPSTTSTTRAAETPAKPTPTTSTAPAATTSTPRQPDLDGKADSAKLLGTTPRSSTPAVPVAADAALKSQLDAARATGNPNPNASTAASEWKQPFATKTKYEIGTDFAGVRAGGILGKGNSGPGVEDLQGRLNTALKGTGANSLATDGLFGPKTEANLRTYQESRGLPVTGQLDAATAGALETNKAAKAGWQPSTSASLAAANAATGGTTDTTNASTVVSASTAGMSEQQKFDHYKALIERSGGRFNPNGPNIVGVRNPTNTNANGGGGTYDDTFAVITMKGGRPSVQEFRGNTEPAGSYRNRMGQDVNGDGRLDQGQLRPGFYEYSSSSYRGGPALRMRGDSVVDRDTNRDGTFGNDGGATSRGGASMLFHRGGNNTTGSAGCQTMPPAEFDRFMGALRNAGMGPGGAVGYTLVNSG